MIFKLDYNITQNRTIQCSEILNSHLVVLYKYITANNPQWCARAFNELTYELCPEPKLNVLDKFIILAELYSLCFSDNITLQVPGFDGNVVIKTSTMLDNFYKLKEKWNNVIIDIESIKMTIGIPLELKGSYGLIDYIIEIYGQQINEEIFNVLPAKAVKEIANYKKYVDDTLKSVITIPENKNINLTMECLSIDYILGYLTRLYSDNLLSFYNLQYQFITKIGLSYDHFLKLTNAETKIMCNFYESDIKKQEQEQKNQSNHAYMH